MDPSGSGPAAPAVADDTFFSHHPVGAVGALAALGGAAFCFVTGESLPVGLLPQLSAGLRVSLSAVGLLVTIYAVVVVAVSAPLILLFDELGLRQVHLVLERQLAFSIDGPHGAANGGQGSHHPR